MKREREGDRQTDRNREQERERETLVSMLRNKESLVFISYWRCCSTYTMADIIGCKKLGGSDVTLSRTEDVT